MNNFNKEEQLDKAAYELSDGIWPIKDKLEKVNLLMGDIISEFFRKYDPEEEQDRNFMAYNFNRFTLLSEISHTLIWEAYQEIEGLEKRATKTIKEKILSEKEVI